MSNAYLTRIRLQQYRSFSDLDISLPDGPSVLVVHGSNGIGKSSLFDGLEWALTDKIDHYRDADGVKKVGNYLCRWRDAAPGPTSVTVDFSGGNVLSRSLSSGEATKSVLRGNIPDIASFLRHDDWKREISGVSSYLLLTHFLGQSAISRLTNRDPGERFDILKEAAQSKEIEEVANALHGIGNTSASRAYSKRIKSIEDEVVRLDSLLETEASLWSGLASVGALDNTAAAEITQNISQLLSDTHAGESTPANILFDHNTITALDGRVSEQRARLRYQEMELEEAMRLLAKWDLASRQAAELHSANETTATQIAILDQQRVVALASLESARLEEGSSNAAAREAREIHKSYVGLSEALKVLEVAIARKQKADPAFVAAKTVADNEAACVSALERRLQLVRRVESGVGRLDERISLAQTELSNVREWLSRDARIANLRSNVAGLESSFPALDSAIELGEERLRLSKHALDQQSEVLTELQSTVTAMSSAVATIAGKLSNDTCDCPVCNTHFEVEGELHRRAASAAERLAPLVVLQFERVQAATDEWTQWTVHLGQLRSKKLELESLAKEIQFEEQANRAPTVSLFGSDDADRAMAQTRQEELSKSVEELARRRRRQWLWRNRLSAAFFVAGGEYSSALRRRDQTVGLLNTAVQEQNSAAQEVDVASANVAELDQAIGRNFLRGYELTLTLDAAAVEFERLESDLRQFSANREAIEQQLSSIEASRASAVTRQHQIVEQLQAVTAQKSEATDAWQKLSFVASLEPELLTPSLVEVIIARTRDKLRQADDLLKQLREGRAATALVENHRVSLEGLRTAVSGAPNSERLQLRKEAEEIRKTKVRLAEATRQTKDIARLASAAIINELSDFNTSYMQPLAVLMKSISRAILCDPRVGIEWNVTNRRVEQAAVKDGQVPVDMGHIDPILVHSEGQMAALSVSMLCAASLTYPWSKWRGLVLDDPLQHNDAIHSAAFADFICNLVAERGYQVLLSTHDRAQAEFLRRKVTSRNLPCGILSLLGTGQDGVEWSYQAAEEVGRAVALA